MSYNKFNVNPSPEVVQQVLVDILTSASKIKELEGPNPIVKFLDGNKTTRFELIYDATRKYPVNVFVWVVFTTHRHDVPTVLLLKAVDMRVQMQLRAEAVEELDRATALPLIKHDNNLLPDCFGMTKEAFDVVVDDVIEPFVAEVQQTAQAAEEFGNNDFLALCANKIEPIWNNGQDLLKLFAYYLVESQIAGRD